MKVRRESLSAHDSEKCFFWYGTKYRCGSVPAGSPARISPLPCAKLPVI